MHGDDRKRARRGHPLLGTATDRLLLIAAVSGALLLWWGQRGALAGGPLTARIYHDHRLLAAYPLDGRVAPLIYAADGDLGTSHIRISAEGVRFLDSPCDGKRCVHAGARHEAGELLACAPNGVLVRLTGGAADAATALDAVVE